jgi:NlpC/P60 family
MPTGDQIVQTAESALGTPYVWGGNSLTNGVDCSGLVQQVYAAYGIQLPRTTYDQINVGDSVLMNKLRPGDLVFFDTDNSKKGPDHVGIYIGSGKFIQAPAPGKSVNIQSLTDSYYASRFMGARRISGVDASGGFQPGMPQPVQPKLDATTLAQEYGMSYAFFKSQPELMSLLNKAVAGQWTADKFQAEVQNTKWWKDNSDSARQAQVQQKTDPATFAASMAAAKQQASDAANAAGATLSDKNLTDLATNMVRFGWDENQINNFLGQYIKFGQNATLGGTAGQAANAIRQTAYNMGVSVTDQSVLNNAAYITRGLTTQTDINNQLRSQAMGLYPAFADQIKGGATVQDIAAPYAQALAQTLGLPDTQVDAFNPKIQAALNHVGQDGKVAPLSLDEFNTQVRSDPAWNATPTATNQATATGRLVLQNMGLVA